RTPYVSPLSLHDALPISRFWIGQQPLGLRAQHVGLVQFMLLRAASQLVIRRGVPEEEREARRQRVVVEPSGFLFEVNEFRRTQQDRKSTRLNSSHVSISY